MRFVYSIDRFMDFVKRWNACLDYCDDIRDGDDRNNLFIPTITCPRRATAWGIPGSLPVRKSVPGGLFLSSPGQCKCDECRGTHWGGCDSCLTKGQTSIPLCQYCVLCKRSHLKGSNCLGSDTAEVEKRIDQFLQEFLGIFFELLDLSSSISRGDEAVVPRQQAHADEIHAISGQLFPLINMYLFVPEDSPDVDTKVLSDDFPHALLTLLSCIRKRM